MQGGLPEPGDIIAEKYVVERMLGRGGMGAVYAVVHRTTGKRLALKSLLPAYLDDAHVVERFLREARAAGRIQHRHVIDVFDAGRDHNVLYIVMPLLQGKPLSELLHDEKLTLEEALVIMVRAMEGVAAAHDLGIVHRDLKPGNIFVCVGVSGRLDDPRVLDFGISKLDDEATTSLTRSGMAVGTPHYMALEQLTGQRDLDHRVDVYALGVILYEAMVGKPPYTADNIAALAIKLLHSPPRKLAQLRPDLPEGLSDVVMRALAVDREERFSSVRALITALLPFVPQSAGLTMPEPQGLPLRTPRDSSAPALVGGLASASAATTPSGSPSAIHGAPTALSAPPPPEAPSSGFAARIPRPPPSEAPEALGKTEAQSSLRPRARGLTRGRWLLAGTLSAAALAIGGMALTRSPRERDAPDATPARVMGRVANPMQSAEPTMLPQAPAALPQALTPAPQPLAPDASAASAPEPPRVAPSRAEPVRARKSVPEPALHDAGSERGRAAPSATERVERVLEREPGVDTRAGKLSPEEF